MTLDIIVTLLTRKHGVPDHYVPGMLAIWRSSPFPQKQTTTPNAVSITCGQDGETIHLKLDRADFTIKGEEGIAFSREAIRCTVDSDDDQTLSHLEQLFSEQETRATDFARWRGIGA